MKIIIEGADGTGKTTLSQKLLKHYNIKSYVHVNREDPNDYDFYKQTMKKTSVLFDRHFIGEMIYPKIFNRKQNLNTLTFEMLLEQSKKEQVKIIILYTDNFTLEERIIQKSESHEEFEEVIQNILEINRQFLEIAAKYHIEIIDTSKVSFKDICEKLTLYTKN
jgi:thymidylate kinase